jgi:hypothetical protein
MADDYKTFVALLRKLEGLQDRLRENDRVFKEHYDAALKKDFKLVNRGKWDYTKFDACPHGDAIRARYKALADGWFKGKFVPYEDGIKKQLDELALVVNPPKTKTLNMVHVVYSGTYNSQGYGAMKYTEEAAERKADHIRLCGFKAEVRPEGKLYRDPHYGVCSQSFAVWANVDRDGYEVLKRKPGLTLRDWVKACWKKGINPRVENPFLPPGIEEKLGIDYYGNDLDGSKPLKT